jgi:hypothetical protein
MDDRSRFSTRVTHDFGKFGFQSQEFSMRYNPGVQTETSGLAKSFRSIFMQGEFGYLLAVFRYLDMNRSSHVRASRMCPVPLNGSCDVRIVRSIELRYKQKHFA